VTAQDVHSELGTTRSELAAAARLNPPAELETVQDNPSTSTLGVPGLAGVPQA